jgi:Putative peptidoglycan binding domain
MGWYIAKEGDHVTSIAAAHGFSDYREIWNDPANADLKSKRIDPNVLLPGDRLFIPDLRVAEYMRPTDVCHKFKLTATNLQLRIELQRAFAPPIASNPCPMRIDGEYYATTATDKQGLVAHKIDNTAAQGSLLIRNFVQGIRGEKPSDRTVKLRIGWLDPIDSISGQQARLINLGYYRGSLDEYDPDEMRSAVEEFQCDQGLGVDGDCGPKTQGRLQKVYGC